MRIEKGDAATVHPQTLPYTVPENESRIEHRYQRLPARAQLAVYVHENVAIARVVGGVMRRLCHDFRTLCGGRGAASVRILARRAAVPEGAALRACLPAIPGADLG